MPANTSPIFPISPTYGSIGLTLSNFAKTGTVAFGATPYGSSFYGVFSAGAFGSRIDQIKVRSLGPNSATVLRLFVSDAAGSFHNLIHETTLAAQGTQSASITVTAQGSSATGSTFTCTSHGLSVGQFVYCTSVTTLTGITANNGYYVASVPASNTFTLVGVTGGYINPSTYLAGSATLFPFTNFETSATTDYDIVITKNSTETAPPIPYLEAGHRLVATVGSIGSTFVNTGGWQISVFGGDY